MFLVCAGRHQGLAVSSQIPCHVRSHQCRCHILPLTLDLERESHTHTHTHTQTHTTELQSPRKTRSQGSRGKDRQYNLLKNVFIMCWQTLLEPPSCAARPHILPARQQAYRENTPPRSQIPSGTSSLTPLCLEHWWWPVFLPSRDTRDLGGKQVFAVVGGALQPVVEVTYRGAFLALFPKDLLVIPSSHMRCLLSLW